MHARTTFLARREGVTYPQLGEIIVAEKEVNARNRPSRGKFTAAFLLQCLEAIGISQLRLD
ncbi:MAG: hypothetical protein COA62_13620 [Rhodobiaceae bacterium]|nr:MAG: hypothetical protein COA62_13620 [Rhodobiaceae bacterium]